jgi:hypothetical protein
MLAEFMENATSFSPPTADVRVTGTLASRGYAIDIEDRGLGMTEQELLEANARLLEPPTFDLSGSDRLGLRVAAQLAHRHSIRLTLRESPYGGTTAIVLIPMGLVVQLESPAADTVLPVAAEPEPPGAEPYGRHAITIAPPAPMVPAEADLATSVATVPPETRNDASEDSAAGAWTENGLPVRVRQQALAPPLREDPALANGTGDGPSPDAARQVMSDFWHGRSRGLSQPDEQQPDGEAR